MHQRTARALARIRASGFAEKVIAKGEDPEEFYTLCDDLLLEFSPAGALQEEYIKPIARALWRKLHPLSIRVKSAEPKSSLSAGAITVAAAMALYRRNEAKAKGLTSDEELAKAGHGAQPEKTMTAEEAKTNQQEIQTDHIALREQREIAMQLDEQINQAVRQMLALKQMQRTNDLLA